MTYCYTFCLLLVFLFLFCAVIDTESRSSADDIIHTNVSERFIGLNNTHVLRVHLYGVFRFVFQPVFAVLVSASVDVLVYCFHGFDYLSLKKMCLPNCATGFRPFAQ